MYYKYGKHTREFLGAFLFPFQSSFPWFWSAFNKTIIPLALVGYEMIIANEAPSWLSIISYPTRTCVKRVMAVYNSIVYELNLAENLRAYCGWDLQIKLIWFVNSLLTSSIFFVQVIFFQIQESSHIARKKIPHSKYRFLITMMPKEWKKIFFLHFKAKRTKETISDSEECYV